MIGLIDEKHNLIHKTLASCFQLRDPRLSCNRKGTLADPALCSIHGSTCSIAYFRDATTQKLYEYVTKIFQEIRVTNTISNKPPRFVLLSEIGNIRPKCEAHLQQLKAAQPRSIFAAAWRPTAHNLRHRQFLSGLGGPSASCAR